MPIIEHGEILTTSHPSANRGIHPIEGFNEVADEAARAAIVQVAADRGRVVFQSAGILYGWYVADGAGEWTWIGSADVDLETHAARHLPAGSDPLATAAPTGNSEIGDTNAAGVAESYARSDHEHAFPGPEAAPPDVAAVAAEGISSRPSRQDHTHGGVTSLGVTKGAIAYGIAGVIANVTKAAASAGVEETPARSDHKHDASTAAPTATGVATASAEGVATSFARSDHAHQSNTLPTAQTISAGTIGTSGQPARADHVHPQAALAPAAHAASHLPSGSDPLTTAAPSTGVGGANAVGTAESFARSDHNHKLRTTTGPTDLDIAALVDGEFLKRSGTQIVSAAVDAGVVNVLDAFPIYVCPVDGTQLQVLWDSANLEGCLCFLPVDTTLNRIAFRTGVSWSGTFTERVCIWQAANGAITTTMTLVVNQTFTNAAAAASTTFLVTVSEITLKKGWYIIALGRSSGAGSPYLDSLSQSPIGLHNENLSGMPSTFGNIVSVASPPATLDPTTQTSTSGADLCILHKFKKV